MYHKWVKVLVALVMWHVPVISLLTFGHLYGRLAEERPRFPAVAYYLPETTIGAWLMQVGYTWMLYRAFRQDLNNDGWINARAVAKWLLPAALVVPQQVSVAVIPWLALWSGPAYYLVFLNAVGYGICTLMCWCMRHHTWCNVISQLHAFYHLYSAFIGYDIGMLRMGIRFKWT